MFKKIIKTLLIVFCGFAVISCTNDKIATDDGGNYFQNIEEFHKSYFVKEQNILKSNDLSLFVDFSTCNVLGQSSPFYQALIPSWVSATKHFYSIKGDIIESAGDKPETFNLLRTITEVNYADLKSAIEMMADNSSESVLLTDGEYYQKSLAKGNINNPYMAKAFATWLKKGHDIFILSEPYLEPGKGTNYNKKRFYIIFTDVRLQDNVYDRIKETVQLESFPDVKIFHLSTDHPTLSAEGTSTNPNGNLSAKVNGFGIFEAQEWEIDWKDGIEPLIVNAVDPQNGEDLPDGDTFTGGLKVDRNSFGGFRITNVSAKVYNINQEFSDFCAAKTSGENYNNDFTLSPYENFIKLDEEEFKNHGIINFYFDKSMFTPDPVLNGSPYNFFKIDIYVSEVQNIFSQFAEQFYFDSIDLPGNTNTSVAESIKQCLVNPDIKAMVLTSPIYTIYVKSPER